MDDADGFIEAGQGLFRFSPFLELDALVVFIHRLAIIRPEKLVDEGIYFLARGRVAGLEPHGAADGHHAFEIVTLFRHEQGVPVGIDHVLARNAFFRYGALVIFFRLKVVALCLLNFPEKIIGVARIAGFRGLEEHLLCLFVLFAGIETPALFVVACRREQMLAQRKDQGQGQYQYCFFHCF